MKLHAFLLQVHAYPKQLEALIDLLKAPNHYFFIHVDKKSRQMMQTSEIARLKKRADVTFVPSVRVNHGGFSMVRATLNMLEAAIASPKKFDYFHLISGQDYPCMSSAALDAVFEAGERSYMYFDSPEETENWRKNKYLSRTQHYNYTDLYIPLVPQKIQTWMIKGLNKFAKSYKRPPIPNIYAGWQWFSWHRKVVEYVLRFLKDNP
ncbi:MAG: beta-1,6-N-acetylglucosaminyltransferase, partial [Candidatus Symbiothrix sp.]|nr:beta-1,6-N-acetylglucosaminyltransferase [Candidatus Symbiothrix sp.]